MRQQRRDTPLFPHAVLLMCCAIGCIAAAPATQYRCGFNVMRKRSGPFSNVVVREVPRKGQGAMQAYTVATQDYDSGWEPIRIAVSTEGLERGTNKRKYCEVGEDECYNALVQRVSCKAEHVLTEAKTQSHIRKILFGAVKLHTERLLVKPTGGTITVPRATNGPCSHFTIPTRHKSDGVPDADFIIYAFAGPSGTDSRAFWAATCNTWGDLRPYISSMNFDPKYMTDTAWSVRVAAHEIAHALGFSQESMREKSLVKKPERSVRGTHHRMLAGKNVQEKAKAHFGCKSLEGMVLEDEDGPREKRNPSLEGTPRAGRADAPAVGAGYYTAPTMAVFVGMGYYRVNWSMAEPMSWAAAVAATSWSKSAIQPIILPPSILTFLRC
ncbi:surface protease GP63, putative [Trypanosoma cruzi]|nr:surface protease GP63, putative [Trypanosoma cruzi]